MHDYSDAVWVIIQVCTVIVLCVYSLFAVQMHVYSRRREVDARGLQAIVRLVVVFVACGIAHFMKVFPILPGWALAAVMIFLAGAGIALCHSKTAEELGHVLQRSERARRDEAPEGES